MFYFTLFLLRKREQIKYLVTFTYKLKWDFYLY